MSAPTRLRRWWTVIGPAVTDERVAVQLVAVIVGAVLAAVAAILYSGASGSWQQAIRDETQRTAGLQEQVRTVYGDEAPVAFRVATAQVRARALRTVKGTSRLAASEQTVAEQLAFQLSQSSPPGSLAAARQYVLPEGGFDVPRRLADLIKSEPLPPDADATAADGDGQALLAGIVGVVTVVITGVAVAGAAMPRRRRRDGDDEEVPEIIPQPGLAAAQRRRATILLLVLWAAGVLLPFAQLALSAEEQRSQAASARIAVQLSGQIAMGLARTGFETNALRDAAFADVAATSRELAALDAPDADAAGERAVARVEENAAAVDRDIATRMGEVPAAAGGVGAGTVAALGSGKNDWEATLARQSAEADRANFYGNWSNYAVAAIAVVVALTAWFEIATSVRRQREPE